MAYIIAWSELLRILSRRRDDDRQAKVPLYYIEEESFITIYYTFHGQELKAVIDISTASVEEVLDFKNKYLAANSAFKIVGNQDEVISIKEREDLENY